MRAKAAFADSRPLWTSFGKYLRRCSTQVGEQCQEKARSITKLFCFGKSSFTLRFCSHARCHARGPSKVSVHRASNHFQDSPSQHLDHSTCDEIVAWRLCGSALCDVRHEFCIFLCLQVDSETPVSSWQFVRVQTRTIRVHGSIINILRLGVGVEVHKTV